jgi:hypothetical protein
LARLARLARLGCGQRSIIIILWQPAWSAITYICTLRCPYVRWGQVLTRPYIGSNFDPYLEEKLAPT